MDHGSPRRALSLDRSRAALVDDLARRLALTRATVLLHEAVMLRHRTSGTYPGGPTLRELEEQTDAERRHAASLEQAVLALDGDASQGSAGSRVEARLASGIAAVAVDPRTDLAGAIRALLIAELVAQDGLESSCALARTAGADHLVALLEEILSGHARHLATARSWAAAAQVQDLSRAR